VALTPQRLVLGAGALFVLTLALITSFELLTGQPLAASVDGKQGSGVSVLGGTEGSDADDSPEPASSAPASTAPASTAPSSTSAPTPTVTVTLTPSASPSVTQPSTPPATPPATPSATPSAAPSGTPTGTPPAGSGGAVLPPPAGGTAGTSAGG
jgi:hypothetical protein